MTFSPKNRHKGQLIHLAEQLSHHAHNRPSDDNQSLLVAGWIPADELPKGYQKHEEKPLVPILSNHDYTLTRENLSKWSETLQKISVNQDKENKLQAFLETCVALVTETTTTITFRLTHVLSPLDFCIQIKTHHENQAKDVTASYHVTLDDTLHGLSWFKPKDTQELRCVNESPIKNQTTYLGSYNDVPLYMGASYLIKTSPDEHPVIRGIRIQIRPSGRFPVPYLTAHPQFEARPCEVIASYVDHNGDELESSELANNYPVIQRASQLRDPYVEVLWKNHTLTQNEQPQQATVTIHPFHMITRWIVSNYVTTSNKNDNETFI